MLMTAHPPEPEPRRLSWRQRWGAALAIPAALLAGQGYDVAMANTAQAGTCKSIGTVAQAKGGYDPGCPGPIGPIEKKIYKFTFLAAVGGWAGGLRGAVAGAGSAVASWIF